MSKNKIFTSKIYKITIFLFILFSFETLFSQGIEDATTYHKNSSVQENIALETINLVSWRKSEKILDIGCGDGKITALLCKKVPLGSVLGLDISQKMIEFASNHYPKSTYSNLSFLNLDAKEIKFKNYFNKIVSFSTFHWLLEQEKVLKVIYKALITKGEICIHTYGQGKMNVTDICEATINTKKWKPFFLNHTKTRIFLTKQEFYNLLKQTGFKKIKIIESYKETYFPNKKAVFDFVKPLLTSTQHLSKEQQQEFAQEVVEKICLLASYSKNGEIIYQTLNLQATGIK